MSINSNSTAKENNKSEVKASGAIENKNQAWTHSSF